MAANTSKNANWRTPPELIERIRAALGGAITLDAASHEQANVAVKAKRILTKEQNALKLSWVPAFKPGARPTLFLNPPGDLSGQTVREFWKKFRIYGPTFWAACWLGFNLDQLRFVDRLPGSRLVIPQKRIAYINPESGLPGVAPTIGSYLYFLGNYDISGFRADCTVWP